MKNGFTLIELLVVIAIIGILASMIVVSFSGAIDKSKDTRIISSMAQMRKLAKIIQVEHGSYDVSGADEEFNCTANATADMRTLCDDIDEQKGVGASEFPTFHTDIDEYCAYIQLMGGRYFCIDEHRAVLTGTNPSASHCNASSWDCPPETDDDGC